MDHRRRVIRTPAEADELRRQIIASIERTVKQLRECRCEPIAQFKEMKFDRVGYDPLTEEPLNIVEQLNQTFTMLATVEAVKKLFELHPDAGGFRVALGACSGRDISSVVPDLVAAETFSATDPKSNDKLRKDLDRLAHDTALHRYVFFAARNFGAGRRRELEQGGVQVYAVEGR